jgi:aryl-alcohol dehydrogenase-like predicted oxidoreductase
MCLIPFRCPTRAWHHNIAIARAAATGAGIILRGGIAQGGPDAEIQRPALNEVWNQAKLDELLPAGMSRAELILRDTLSLPDCHTTIVGTCNPAHFEENLQAALRGPLSSDLVRQIADRVSGVLEWPAH